jgi:hypothetical protein
MIEADRRFFEALLAAAATTHLFVRRDGAWTFVSAQGTPTAP